MTLYLKSRERSLDSGAPMNTNNTNGTVDDNFVTKSEVANIRLTGPGNDDKSPYMKADLIRACRVNESIAILFYQVDYQALANAMAAAEAAGSREAAMTNAILVGKIVFDQSGFDRCLEELNRLQDKLGTRAT